MTPHTYARTHADRFLAQLIEWLRIPSISTAQEHRGDIRRAAEWLAEELRHVGLKHVMIYPTEGHPVVYAEWLDAGAHAPTLLIYGHYDVQPAVPGDGWTSDPFVPDVRDDALYARGASDDKGQVWIHVKALESYLASEGRLPVNVKLLIEGEEEVGSPHLRAFVRAHAEMLRADLCVISDTAIFAPDVPSIPYTLRGMAYMEIHVEGPAADLHSGGFGGAVHNPAQALAEILAQLHAPDGSVAVPGFYDAVVPMDDAERAELAGTDWSAEQWRAMTGVPQVWGESAFTLRERIGARPTLEVNGLYSGFTGEGVKTVLPAKAMAKISCRLVQNQDPDTIFRLVSEHVARLTPPTVRSSVRLLAASPASATDRALPQMQAAVNAYTHVWGKRPLFMRAGGSLPIMAHLQSDLNLPVLLIGFGLHDDSAHGPDEHFHLDLFYRGIDTIIHFYREVADGASL